MVARSGLLRPRWDLGLRALVPELRAMAGEPKPDLLAGLGAASLVLPLALLAAVDAGVAPVAAIVTTLVAGLVGTLLGGSRIGSSGPALAASATLSALVVEHGVEALGLACLLSGVLQLVAGVLGAGRVTNLVPLGVTRGFVLGLGATLLLQALPHVLGVETPANLSSLELLDHLGAQIPHAPVPGLVIAGVTLVLAGLALRFAPFAPVTLLVALAAAPVVWLAALEVPTLGEGSLSAPQLGVPALPHTDIASIVGLSITLALASSLETLLSSNAQRESDPERRGDPDQDLLANGLVCIALAFAGGLPASASIARAEPLRLARPRSRLAGLVVAVVAGCVGLLVLALGAYVPLAAIAAGALLAALVLLDPRPLLSLVRASRAEAANALVTLLAITLLGLANGVLVGLVLSLLASVSRVARSRASFSEGKSGAPHQLALGGPITFLSAPTLLDLRARLESLEASEGLVIDLRSVSFVDATGAARLLELTRAMQGRGGRVALLGVSPQCRVPIERADHAKSLEDRFAVSDRDVDRILVKKGAFSAEKHVLAGLSRFRAEMREHYLPLFDQLADGQSPHTLLVTCVDSRINPELLTGAHPGELFIVRCLGALVSPVGEDNLPSEAAAVEYAVGVLGVRNVIVCGHSQCGAIKALKTGHVPGELASLGRWSQRAELASGDLHVHDDLDAACRAATAKQLENLRTIPQVAEREAQGALRLSAWFYDVGKAEVFEWDATKSDYVLAGEARASAAPSP